MKSIKLFLLTVSIFWTSAAWCQRYDVTFSDLGSGRYAGSYAGTFTTGASVGPFGDFLITSFSITVGDCADPRNCTYSVPDHGATAPVYDSINNVITAPGLLNDFFANACVETSFTGLTGCVYVFNHLELSPRGTWATYNAYDPWVSVCGGQYCRSGNYEITRAVPEPESYAMLLAGLGLLGFTARRRKQ